MNRTVLRGIGFLLAAGAIGFGLHQLDKLRDQSGPGGGGILVILAIAAVAWIASNRH